MDDAAETMDEGTTPLRTKNDAAADGGAVMAPLTTKTSLTPSRRHGCGHRLGYSADTDVVVDGHKRPRRQ